MSELTPQRIEARLLELGKEIDDAHAQLVAAENHYHSKKVACEIALAKARLAHHGNGRVQDVNDRATVTCENQLTDLAIAEASVKAARANANRIRTQVDIARSIGTSVRASLDLA